LVDGDLVPRRRGSPAALVGRDDVAFSVDVGFSGLSSKNITSTETLRHILHFHINRHGHDLAVTPGGVIRTG
jgi:hypothetical protein